MYLTKLIKSVGHFLSKPYGGLRGIEFLNIRVECLTDLYPLPEERRIEPSGTLHFSFTAVRTIA